MMGIVLKTLFGMGLCHIEHMLRGNPIQMIIAVFVLVFGPATALFAVALPFIGVEAAMVAGLVAAIATVIFWSRQ